jgi:hypothetical protein
MLTVGLKKNGQVKKKLTQFFWFLISVKMVLLKTG